MRRVDYKSVSSGIIYSIGPETWNDVYSKGADLQIETIISGYLDCQIDRMINLDHPNAADIKAGIVNIPVFVHILKHPVFGNFLIDAGLDSSYQTSPMGRTKGFLAKKIMPMGRQSREQNAASYLRRKNISISGIFLSHLHMDHMAGIADYPKGTPIIIAKGEKPATVFPFVYDDYLIGVGEMQEIDMTRGQRISPFEKCVDLFGDGSFWAISTPGHTKNHISFFINAKNNPTLIAADACHLRLCVERKTGPGAFSYNVRMAQDSLLKVIEFSENHPNVRILFGHG
jgi:N-acyl homoserine lactone hydrolase